MDNVQSSAVKPKRGNRGLRILFVLVAGLAVLVVVAYLVITSNAFLRGFVLPKAGQALHADISISDGSVSPFSQVVLNNLKVQPVGADPLLTVQQVTVRYNLMSILRGNYVVDELSLVSPSIQLIRDPSGKSNLDAILTNQAPAKPGSTKSQEPIKVAVRNVSIKEGTVRMENRATGGRVDSTTLNHLNLNLDRLENGQSGHISLSSDLIVDGKLPAGAKGTNDLLEAKANGNFTFAVDAKLAPQSLSGTGRVDLARGEGTYKDLAALGAALQADVTPTEIRQLALRFERSGQTLGRVQASGPLNLAQSEGHLRLEVQDIDRQVLNIVGASRGWDFANSRINATNQVDITQQGKVIGAKGQVVGQQIGIRQQSQSSPAVDLLVDYDVTVNNPAQSATVNALTLSGQLARKDLLHASLNRPMTLSWAPNAGQVPESTFQLSFNGLNLKDWQLLTGTNAPSGVLDLQLTVVAKQDGKQLAATSTTTIRDLAVSVGTNRLEQLQVSVNFDGKLDNMKALTLNQYRAELLQKNQRFLTTSGSGRVDLSSKDADLQTSTDIALPALLQQFSVAGTRASQGALQVTSTVAQKGTVRSLVGNLVLKDFTGAYGQYQFTNLQTRSDFNLGMNGSEVQIQKLQIALQQGAASAGLIDLSGGYNSGTGASKANFKISDLNQNILGSLLAPSLGSRKLVSIALNGNGSASYDPTGDAALQAGLSVTNWVVIDPLETTKTPPLSGQVQLDGAMQKQVFNLKQCLLRLSPTARAKNELQVTAHLDFAKTNATPSQLTLQSEALDLNPYYDMFKAQPGKSGATSSASPPPSASRQAEEPAPIALPIQQLVAEMKIGSLYLGEVTVSNMQSTVTIRNGEINVKPLQLNLNGGTVNGAALINVAVPGYTYDVSFQADRVPLEPLSNTFTTNSPGQIKGELLTQAQIKGAGITDANLRKNLAGNFSLNLTNLNYEIVGKKTKRLVEPIAVVLGIPELLQTPLNLIVAQTSIGKGQIDLQQFLVQSTSFKATSQGTIPMAEVLTNSPLKLPVTLALRRSLAEKAKLLPANTPTNAAFVDLPSFVTLAGTIGDPKSEINKLVIGGLLARSLGNLPVGNKAGDLLQGIGNLATGQSGASARTNGTTTASTNAAASIVQGLGSLLNQPKKPASTNAPLPSPSQTNKTTKPTAIDLLNLIPEKKQK